MRNSPRYEILPVDPMHPNTLFLRDLGPWDCHPTVTNGIEEVVKELAPILNERNLVYYDSDGEPTGVRYDGDEFQNFYYWRP